MKRKTIKVEKNLEKKKKKTKTTSFIKSLIFRSSRDYFTMSQPTFENDFCSYCSAKCSKKLGRRVVMIKGHCTPAIPKYCKAEGCKYALNPICTQQARDNMPMIAELTDESVELCLHWCKSCIGRAINSQVVTKSAGKVTEERVREIKRAHSNTLFEERPRKSPLAANKVVVDLTEEEEEEATQQTQPTVQPNYDSEDETPLVSSPDVDHQVLGPIERLEEDLPRYSRQFSLEKEKYPKGAVFVSRRTRNQVYDSFFVTIVKE